MSTGAITANMTSAGGVGVSGGSANFYSFGANTTTSGGFAFQSVSSNASVNFNALTLAANTGDATFAGNVVNVTPASGSADLVLKRTANTAGATVSFNTTSTNKYFMGLRGLSNDNFYLYNNVAANTALEFDAATSNATFAGKITANGAGSTFKGTSTNDNMLVRLSPAPLKAGAQYR
jgi:hypothetical protein